MRNQVASSSDRVIASALYDTHYDRRGQGFGIDQQSDVRILFNRLLRQVYWAAGQINIMLPVLGSMCSKPALKEAITLHEAKNLGNIAKLEEAFSLCGVSAKPLDCEVFAALKQDMVDVIDSSKPGSTIRDISIFMLAKKILDYEQSCYSCLFMLSQNLLLSDVQHLLGEVLYTERFINQCLIHAFEQE